MGGLSGWDLEFRLHLRGELLRYAVGRQMFCRHEECGQVVLDCEDAVLMETGGRSQVLCPECFEARTRLITEDEWDAAVATGKIEVTDGRELRRFERLLGSGARV